MLNPLDDRLLESMERIAASKDGGVLLEWLDGSLLKTREAVGEEEADMPKERGQSQLLDRLIKHLRGAHEEIMRRRGR